MTREKLFVLPLLNLFPSDTSHQPLLSGWCLLVSPAARQSKALFLFSTHTSFYHFSTEFLGSLFKSSPSFFSFLFCPDYFCLFGFSLVFLSFFLQGCCGGGLAFPVVPRPPVRGCAQQEGLWGLGFYFKLSMLKIKFLGLQKGQNVLWPGSDSVTDPEQESLSHQLDNR